MRAFARFAFVIALSLFLVACSTSDATETDASAETAAEPTVAPVSMTDATTFNATIDGMAWTATGEIDSFGWFPSGMPGTDSTTPVLQMVFQSTVAGDERRLTVWVSDYPMAVGMVPMEHIEVRLSGSHAGGEGAYAFTPENGDAFDLEITRWEATPSGNYLISGTLGGTLLSSNVSTVVIENGTFENVEIPVQ